MKSSLMKALLMVMMLVVGISAYTGTQAGDKSDTAKIMSTARAYVDNQAVSVGKYKVEIFKKSGKWALVSVLPQGDVEGAGVILEKVGDKWVARDMGTDLSEWEPKAPGLFK